MQRKKVKNSKKSKNLQKQKGEVKMIQDHPPQIDSYQVIHSTCLRFTVTAAVVNKIITFGNMLDAMLVATTAIAGFQLFDLVKVKKIRLWGLAALGTPSTVEIQYNTATGDNVIHTDTSLGIKPAFVHARPSLKSLASFWQLNTGGNCFQVSAPAGSVIDVHLSFKTSSQNPTAVANALVAANPGEFYFRGLDGLATAATNFPPPSGVQTQ